MPSIRCLHDLFLPRGPRPPANRWISDSAILANFQTHLFAITFISLLKELIFVGGVDTANKALERTRVSAFS